VTGPNTKPRGDELIERLPTSGWDLETGNPAFPVKNRTLEELVRTTHARNKKGEAPGIVKHVETELELDLIQLQQLWMHLGLPM